MVDTACYFILKISLYMSILMYVLTNIKVYLTLELLKYIFKSMNL